MEDNSSVRIALVVTESILIWIRGELLIAVFVCLEVFIDCLLLCYCATVRDTLVSGLVKNSLQTSFKCRKARENLKFVEWQLCVGVCGVSRRRQLNLKDAADE